MKMNKSASIIIVMAMCGHATAAPLVEKRAELNGGMASVIEPEEREVPDAKAVGVPAYPGSLFCVIDKGSWGEDGWTIVTLLSTDPYEKVTAWYRKNLKGWYCMDWGGNPDNLVCSDKEPEFESLDPATFNVVDLMRTETSFACKLPGMQTRIEIRYQPDGE